MRIVLLPIFTLILIFACQKPSEESWELKWGHLKTSQYDPNLWLISAPPNSVTEMCGEYQAEGIAAAQKWAASIGRSAYLTFVNCGDPRASIKVTIKQSSCGGTAWADPASRTIHLCSSANTIAADQLILHEMGHIWGMCDQYESGLGFCDTGHMTSQLPAKSVMKWYEQTLQQDDIDGINNLINRADIASNQVWKDFLASQTSGSGNTGDNTANTGGANDIPVIDPASSALYAAVEDESATEVYLYISAPNAMENVAACASSQQECMNDPTKRMAFSKHSQEGARVIYKSQQKISPVSGGVYILLGLGSGEAVVSSTSITLQRKGAE